MSWLVRENYFFCTVILTAVEHKPQGCHMDLNDPLTVISYLISEIVYEHHQIDFMAAKETKNKLTIMINILGKNLG